MRIGIAPDGQQRLFRRRAVPVGNDQRLPRDQGLVRQDPIILLQLGHAASRETSNPGERIPRRDHIDHTTQLLPCSVTLCGKQGSCVFHELLRVVFGVVLPGTARNATIPRISAMPRTSCQANGVFSQTDVRTPAVTSSAQESREVFTGPMSLTPCRYSVNAIAVPTTPIKRIPITVCASSVTFWVQTRDRKPRMTPPSSIPHPVMTGLP